MKYCSLRGWVSFPKELLYRVKKEEVELAEGEGNRETSEGGEGGGTLDVEIDDPAGISPAKHLS